MSISLFLVALIGLVYMVLAVRARPWALALLVLLLPAYQLRFSVSGIPGTVLEALILIFVCVAFVQDRGRLIDGARDSFQLLRTRGLMAWIKSPLGLAVVFILWFWVAGLFGLLTTPALQEGLGIWKAYIIEPVLFAVAVALSIRSRGDIVRVLYAAFALVCVVSVVAGAQYVTGWGIPSPWNAEAGRRAVGVYTYPNAVGLLLAPIAAVAFSAAVHGRALFSEARKNAHTAERRFFWFRFTAAVTTLLATVGIVAARADGAVVALAMSIGVTLLFTRLRWFAIALGAVGLAALIAFEPTRDILFFQDVSGDVRLALWSGTWNLIAHQPLFGAGLGAFPYSYEIYRLASHVELLQYAHNILLDFWTQLGVLGAAWIVTVLVGAVWVTVCRRTATDRLSLLALAGIISVVVYGLVDVPYFKNDLAVVSWGLFAAAWWAYAQKAKPRA